MTSLSRELEKEYGRDFLLATSALVGKVRNDIVHDVDRATIAPPSPMLREN